MLASIAENFGHAMIYKILTDDTHNKKCCSNICSALNPSAQNLCLDLSDGQYEGSTSLLSNYKITLPNLDPEKCAEIIKPANYLRQDMTMVVISTEDMVG